MHLKEKLLLKFDQEWNEDVRHWFKSDGSINMKIYDQRSKPNHWLTSCLWCNNWRKMVANSQTLFWWWLWSMESLNYPYKPNTYFCPLHLKKETTSFTMVCLGLNAPKIVSLSTRKICVPIKWMWCNVPITIYIFV